MAGAIWGNDPGGFIAPEHQLMNPSIWGSGDIHGGGPPPSQPHWGPGPGLPPGPHHPPAGPPPNPSFQPHPNPGAQPHPGFPGPGPAKNPWDGPGGWHPAQAPAHPNAPTGWGGPGGPHAWPQQPPTPNTAGHGSGHGAGHGRHGGHGGGSAMHGPGPQQPNSAPPHVASSHSNATNPSFQWSNAQPPFGPAASNAPNKSFAETVSQPGRGVMGPGPGGAPGGPRGLPFDQPWGAPPGAPPNVDQGKPWNVPAPNESGKEWDTKGTGHWGDPNTGGPPASGHHPSGWGSNQPGGHGGDWQNHRDNGTGMWNQGGGPGHGGHQGGGGGWGGPHPHAGGPPNQNRPGPVPWDQGPAPAAPSNHPPNDNVWVPPGPMETNNDMIWHDPNPKTKKPVIDKGTGHWGDPADDKWGKIKRWKDGGDDVVVSSAWAGSPLAPSGEGSTPSGPPAKVASSTSAPGATGWGDPPRTAGPDWTASAPASATPTDGWGKTDEQGQTGGSDAKSNPASSGLNFTDNPNLRDLTAQIAEQLRVAVEKGLINMNILNQPLPQNVLLVLNNLLQRVPKLESATKELASLTASPNASSPAQQQEIQRVQMEVSKLKTEIHELQSQINRSTVSDGRENSGATTPGDGGSKLSLWKTDDKAKATGLNAMPIQLGELADTLSGIGGFNTTNSDVWGTGNKLPHGLNSWANGDTKSETGSLKKASSGNNSSSATPTPSADALPKEFVPGRKWEWSDPKEMAEDPNATPGSLKPNPLSVGSGLGSVNSASNSASFGLGGNITPTKLSNPTTASLSPSMSAGIWGHGQGRTTTAIAGNGRVPPVSRSVSSPVGPQSAFQPFPSASFVVLSNTGGLSEANLAAIASKAGNLVNLAQSPANHIALLKYAENVGNDQAVLGRLHAELSQFGVKVQPADEGQAQNLLQVMGGQSQSRSGAPTPSPLWAEPGVPATTSGGAWGAPPFPNSGGGPEHQSFPDSSPAF